MLHSNTPYSIGKRYSDNSSFGTQEQIEAYQDMAEALHATDHPALLVMDGVGCYEAYQQGYGKNAYPA